MGCFMNYNYKKKKVELSVGMVQHEIRMNEADKTKYVSNSLEKQLNKYKKHLNKKC